MSVDSTGPGRPRPWERYSLEERSTQYNARATVDNFEDIMTRYEQASADARALLGGVLGVPYGPHPDETLDVFPATEPGAPVLVYIHGGYWRTLSKDESSMMAPTFVEAGAAVVVVNYQLAPAATLDEITRQCRAALAWVHAHAADYNGDPSAIHLCGSSAGGHLVGMLLCGGWHAQFGVPHDVVKSATPISGLFELEPLIGTPFNEWARLDVASAQRLSPLLHLPEKGCPLIVSYGETETPEFKRQSHAYIDAWRERGFDASHVDMPGTNHFDIVLTLADRRSALTRAMLQAMGLA